MKRRAQALCLVRQLIIASLMVSAATIFAATYPPGFQQTFVAGGLASPTAMAFAPDGRLFVCLQTGQIRVIKNGALLPDAFLSITVDPSGERGLLGIAFDPNFSAIRPYVYVYYTVPASPAHNRVSRFSANGDVVQAGSEVQLLNLENLSLTATNHNGGALNFGPDGKLYVAVGDNADGTNSQTLANRLGKILRINDDGTIPNDNPFVGVAGANPAIWALGLRNPYSFAFQPGTGRMFINDVGQSTFEEINLGVAGANYGWPNCEGPCSPPNPSFRDPEYYYGRGGAPHVGCAITSGTFYNPAVSQFPSQYVGKYFFVDFCTAWIDFIDPDSPPAGNNATTFGTAITAFPVSLLTGPDGSLYYLSRGGSGELWRIQFGGPPNGGPSSTGYLDGATCNTIFGWAWDPTQPNSPINVDIVANGQVVTTMLASSFRQDLLNAGIGNGQHAFFFTVPESLKNGQVHSIVVRTTGLNIPLIGSPRSILCGTGGGPVNGGPFSYGYLDRATCDVIAGWAWDPGLPTTPINVDILANGQLVATIAAGTFRQDLLNAGIGNGMHAFFFAVPQSLKNSQLQSISVRVSGQGIILIGSPRSILCGGTGGPVNGGPASWGYLDAATCNVIAGWSWDPGLPTTPINVEILADSQVIATMPAGTFRQDLLNAGIGDGQHAFFFNVPASLKNGQPHTIAVRVAGPNIQLFNSPRSITCSPP